MFTQPHSPLPQDRAPTPLRPGSSIDLFGIRTGSEITELSVAIERSPGVISKGVIAFNPGETLRRLSAEERRKSIEDRAALVTGKDGTVLALAIDGVGEVYVSPEERVSYQIGGEERILGDIPGYILYQALKEKVLNDPSSLHHEEGIRETLRAASQQYQEFLSRIGLDAHLQGSKELLGGCTFSLAIVVPDGRILLVSAGDAIAVAKTMQGVRGTENQLPDTNNAFEPFKELLEEELKRNGSPQAQKDMRKIFNLLFKKTQRNNFTNVESAELDREKIEADLAASLSALSYLSADSQEEITKAVMPLVPATVRGYAFFDGNPRVAEEAQCIEISPSHAAGAIVILSTDGGFENQNPASEEVHRSMLADAQGKSGVYALLCKNQKPEKGAGPEATAVFIEL